MSLLNLEQISMAFGHVALLDKINLVVERGERVCLIGRNGEGKSTLLKIINGDLIADDGQMNATSSCRIARVAQEPEFKEDDTVYHAVAAGLGEVGEWVNQYHELIHQLSTDDSPELLKKLERVQHQLEANDGWSLEQRVDTVLTRLDLPEDKKVSAMSGGWQRRVALAQALVTDPDLLLLDEPTNHLDIRSITWLENQLLEFNGALLFISHDRRFMQNVATRIIELDRGQLTSYPNDYLTYLKVKAANLAAEATQNAKFDKVLAQEEVWIRQGIKARRTRNEGRVRALKQLRLERAKRREVVGKMKLTVDTGQSSGKIVVEAENLSYRYADKPLINDFSMVVMRGDRIGFIGDNGTGKSTLLKLLLGTLEPQQGTITQGTKLQVAYFDQLRAQLNSEQTVFDAVGEGSDTVLINGVNKHVMSYLSDFLFAPERARSPIKSLSGGERNRLLLARMFTQPANVLVLDEPTNDLDVESLELLEEMLLNYEGTLLVVSHDRNFLDNVVTSTLVFDGTGDVSEYVGGYEDWLRQRKPETTAKVEKTAKAEKTAEKPKKAAAKLSYKDQRELDQLPVKIEENENRLAELQDITSQADFYKKEQAEVNQVLAQLQETEDTLAVLYERWEALEN